MHMRGNPDTMTKLTTYNNLIEDIRRELGERVIEALKAGIPIWNIIIDPGIGFAKDSQQNIEIIKNINEIREGILKDMPVLIGASRKKFIKNLLGEKIEIRDYELIVA